MNTAARTGLTILGFIVAAAAGAAIHAAVTGGNEARIEQAVTAKLAAAQADDVNDRIAAHWGALAADPASPVIGNPDGDVTVVEFFDYACPYCKVAKPRLTAAVDGDKHVRLVLKEFPILTPESMIASRVALVANAQGKYRPFHDALMAHQGALTQDVIFETARRAGLNMQTLPRDMQAPGVTAQIVANFNLARAIRAFQTPTYVAGGSAGAHELSSTSASIDFRKEIATARGE